MRRLQSNPMETLLAVAWVGGWVHDLHFTPGTLGFGAGVVPWLALTLLLYVYWRRSGASFGAHIAIFIYGAIALAGAILTVLPLGFLPFQPEQTLMHYLVHGVYAGCQVPLLIYVARGMVRTTPHSAETA